MALSEIIYINFTGGIVSPGILKEVLQIAAEAKIKHVRFGLRQQLIIEVPVIQLAAFIDGCAAKNIPCSSKKEAFPNIVSSYPAVDIFTTDTWVREGVYKDIFNSFEYTPKFKINIIDSNQTFVPFFTGHINWISSAANHFWYLYVRFPKTDPVYCFPELVYTNDIAAVSKALEEMMVKNELKDGSKLFKEMKLKLQFICKPIDEELLFPKFSLPYYEGFNRYNNTNWLGIYRRDETFPVSFLLELCVICMNTKIGQIYTTPWKSIIIKGIENGDRNLWDYVLGKYRINVRHAANELNWQIEDNCEDGLQIKRQVIRYFDKEDVRTYGLSFAVKTKASSSIPGSIVIKKQEVKNPGRLKALERFEILYTTDFNPNTSGLMSFRKGIEKEYLGVYLVSLCKYLYEQSQDQKKAEVENLNTPSITASEKPAANFVRQCKHCFTVYDEAVGDAEQNIAADTNFNDLPDTYSCALCGAGLEDFVEVNLNTLLAREF